MAVELTQIETEIIKNEIIEAMKTVYDPEIPVSIYELGLIYDIVVDTDGRLLMINLTTADMQDAAGAERIVLGIRKRWPWLKHLFADGAYDRGKLMSSAAYHDFVIEVVRKLERQQGFQVLPRRWVVERSFGWMIRWRRLVRDYERRCDISEAMIHIALGCLLLRRVVPP